ncbi:hypothetical protein I4U23_018626 [Adineta vaga]|nr:hypothetical protein I4U23_018626 [Adineta vaga]
MLVVIVLINSLPNVILTDCPLLRSFINDTGILSVNKMILTHSESTIQCQWLIVGSTHQRIVVEFDYILIPVPIEEYLTARCQRASINLWTPGLEHEKVQLCGDRRHIRVGGVGQTLMVQLQINDRKLDVSFHMHYQLIQIEQALSTPSYLSNPSKVSTETYAECGITSIKDSTSFRRVSSRIVGGRQAVPHSHPWQVLLNIYGKFCGAAVLNTNWIITAAHCVNGTNPGNVSAEFGIHDRYITEQSRITRKIKRIVVYPSYYGKSTRWMHDIALLELSESLVFNSYIRSICISSIRDFVHVGKRTLVTGWGETQGTGNFRYLREVEVPIQSNDQCGLESTLWSTTFCAGFCANSTCDACQGDSGGPMIVLHKDRWHLVGLISWGFSCAGLGVYTKISYYTEWITKIVYR